MDLGLQERRAFVAGASSGLGKAVAERLLREGARVAVCSRSAIRIGEAAEDLRRTTDAAAEDVLGVECDVTDDKAVRSAVDRAAEHFGGLDLLVANAGGPPAGTVDDFDADDWRSALDLNLMSTINLTRAALPHLRRSAEAGEPPVSILMITSLSAKQPVPGLYLSNVSRAGVQGFAKSLSEEVGASGITVNTILPGYTRTDRLSHLSEHLSTRSGRTVEEVEADWARNSALRRIGTEEEFAAAAAFLLSRPASFITGVALPVDGGAIKSLL
ncbi:MAG: SDR family oxidoreductase [Rhodothermales bacterium]|nr:SDR family oxidoreductase [Rhodothermales bacterium]